MQHLQEHIVKPWGQNVLLDSPGVYPQFACDSCQGIWTNAWYKSGRLNVTDVLVWILHQDGNCQVYMSFPKKSTLYRKKKMPMKTKSYWKEQEMHDLLKLPCLLITDTVILILWSFFRFKRFLKSQ